VLSTVAVCGDHRIPLIEAYLPPSSLNSLPELLAVLDRFAGRDPILLGDLNVNLEDSTSSRNRDVAKVLAPYGLFDMLPRFRQRKRIRHNCTWWKRVNEVILRSRCDYIMGRDQRLFETILIRDPCHCMMDHYMLKARLLLRPTKSHKAYLRGRKTFPLSPPKGEAITVTDASCNDMKKFILDPLPQEKRVPAKWISLASRKLMATRCSLWRDLKHLRQKA
jgi:hypothetical protein